MDPTPLTTDLSIRETVLAPSLLLLFALGRLRRRPEKSPIFYFPTKNDLSDGSVELIPQRQASWERLENVIPLFACIIIFLIWPSWISSAYYSFSKEVRENPEDKIGRVGGYETLIDTGSGRSV